jgi:soluble lytic murein transglycosylase-like protein
MSWEDEGQGPVWVPVLHVAENTYGLPTDLLARIAYEESSFIEEIIRGTRASSAGALGMMQLMPQFFPTVRVPIPFTDTDVGNQIAEAARLLVSLHHSTNDWVLSIAAYNAGLGNVEKYKGIPPFPETEKYVADITADVPLEETA